MCGTNKRPLLSICIPTYNRGYILREVLDKYVNDSEFDDDVEIVISDNCSTDDTETVCREYASKYRNIRYFRNPKNIRDANFYTVLDYGDGEYLKLLNDWTYCIGKSLQFIKDKIKENINRKTPIFFTGNKIFTAKKSKVIVCDNLDEYVQAVSTYVTSNNLFGCWKDQWSQIEKRERYTELKLQQEDWTYQIVNRSKGCILYNQDIFLWSPVERKILTGYNWFQVHLDNYYTIMMPYIEQGLITEKTYRKDKHYLLEHFKREFCYVYFVNYTDKWRYGTDGTTQLLRKYYKHDPYLILFFLKLPFHYVFLITKSLAKTMLSCAPFCKDK